MKFRMIMGFIFFVLMACGIKGPPLPPLSEETIQKQKGETIVFKTDEVSKTTSADATKADLYPGQHV